MTPEEEKMYKILLSRLYFSVDELRTNVSEKKKTRENEQFWFAWLLLEFVSVTDSTF